MKIIQRVREILKHICFGGPKIEKASFANIQRRSCNYIIDFRIRAKYPRYIFEHTKILSPNLPREPSREYACCFCRLSCRTYTVRTLACVLSTDHSSTILCQMGTYSLNTDPM